jgi:hypothetical protein
VAAPAPWDGENRGCRHSRADWGWPRACPTFLRRSRDLAPASRSGPAGSSSEAPGWLARRPVARAPAAASPVPGAWPQAALSRRTQSRHRRLEAQDRQHQRQQRYGGRSTQPGVLRRRPSGPSRQLDRGRWAPRPGPRAARPRRHNGARRG